VRCALCRNTTALVLRTCRRYLVLHTFCVLCWISLVTHLQMVETRFGRWVLSPSSCVTGASSSPLPPVMTPALSSSEPGNGQQRMRFTFLSSNNHPRSAMESFCAIRLEGHRPGIANEIQRWVLLVVLVPLLNVKRTAVQAVCFWMSLLPSDSVSCASSNG
jgi:hypothetical protein